MKCTFTELYVWELVNPVLVMKISEFQIWINLQAAKPTWHVIFLHINTLHIDITKLLQENKLLVPTESDSQYDLWY